MKSGDPRVIMLRRFAKAMDIPLAELIDEKSAGRNDREALVTKRRSLICAGIFAACVCMALGVRAIALRPSAINRENYNKIRNGMTTEEIEDILGAPREERKGWMLITWDNNDPPIASWKTDWPTEREWRGNKDAIWVGFDIDGRVISKRIGRVFYPDERAARSVLGELREILGVE